MKRLLFADPSLVESHSGISLVVNPAVRAEPVLVRDHEWERVLLGLYLTVLDDGGKVRLWYGCRSSKERNGKHTAYAESDDGVSFVKSGLVIPETMEGSVYVDPNESSDKRYGYFGNLFGHGLYRWTSPDGLHFSRDSTPLLKFESDTQCVLLAAENKPHYVAYVRGWNLASTKNERRRTVMRFAHDTAGEPWPYTPSHPEEASSLPRLSHFIDESDIVLSSEANDPEQTDIYTLAPMRYGDYWFGFATFYRHYIESDVGRYINAGRTTVQCVGSLDGIKWNRYNRESYAKPNLGEHMLYLGRGAIVRGDEIWQYGIAYHTHHGEVDRRAKHGDGTMYRFVQRLDGFVSADSGRNGHLLTRPLECTGDTLHLNIDTDGIGAARVGLLDESGDRIDGFTIDLCDPIRQNSTNAIVSWNGGATINLRGRRLKIEIESDRTKLFAVWFE